MHPARSGCRGTGIAQGDRVIVAERSLPNTDAASGREGPLLGNQGGLIQGADL